MVARFPAARSPRTKLHDRIEAATWLADRGFGKPVQAMAHAAVADDGVIPSSTSCGRWWRMRDGRGAA